MERVAIEGGTLVLDDRTVEDGVLTIEGSRIASVGARHELEVPSDAMHVPVDGCWVMSGFVDLHVHGGGGESFTTTEGTQVLRACEFHLEHGTTSLLATCAGPVDRIPAIISTIAGAACGPDRPPNLLGIHLEGPFISPDYPGAFPPEAVHAPDARLLGEYIDVANGLLRLITLAPERHGAMECVRLAARAGVIVSAGHTGASLAELQRAVAEGVTHSCHLFNAMRPLSHRNPGVIGGVLTTKEISAEIIGDGVHVHPAVVKLAVAAKGSQNVALVTDCVRFAGMPDGCYEEPLGRRSLTIVLKDEVPRTDSGTIAGSILTMNRGVQVLIEKVGLGIIEASRLASSTPARILGVDDRKGSIAPGKDADLVVLDKKDFSVRQVWVAGQCRVDRTRGGGT